MHATCIPGSVAERQLLESFSRMLSELLRFSSASHILKKIPEEMQAHHRVQNAARGVMGPPASRPLPEPSRALGRAGRLLQTHTARANSPTQAPQKADLWEGWSSAQAVELNPFAFADDDADDDLDLNELGL